VRFALVTAFRRLQEVFHLTGGNRLGIIIVLLKDHIAPQREHAADCRLDLMDGAPAVLQQNAVIVIALGSQSDDGDSGVITDMEHAILVVEINRTDLQLPGHLEDIHRAQDDIIPVGTAFATLIAVEFEGIVQAYSHGFDILKHFFSSHM
jgi:hypothetical protein